MDLGHFERNANAHLVDCIESKGRYRSRRRFPAQDLHSTTFATIHLRRRSVSPSDARAKTRRREPSRILTALIGEKGTKVPGRTPAPAEAQISPLFSRSRYQFFASYFSYTSKSYFCNLICSYSSDILETWSGSDMPRSSSLTRQLLSL
jgi:hypothetical protein